MKEYKKLQQLLLSIDGQSYSGYKRIKGFYRFPDYILAIDHVQVDPYAPPSKMRILIQRETVDIPKEYINQKNKRIAVSDFLTRNFYKQSQKFNHSVKGTGTSGLIMIDRCGQEMLERTAVLIKDNQIEVRFEVGLPAAGRRILGKAANRIFQDILPEIIKQALFYRHLNQTALQTQIDLILDQKYLREELPKQNLVAFIANGSILPRESGISDAPLIGAKPFQSPANLEIEFHLPSGKTVTGMGIKKGITLLVGGGFHGKSTVLQALERGVYNHIPNDGREFVLTVSDAVKIRAEDGRSIQKVDISPFINHLPGNKVTKQFSTMNASGSTSQAANVVEALEARASLLLIDEDTSATNFMIRDRRMQQLIVKEKEPITPFVDRVQSLYKDLGVSTILIIGGSGDYFEIADRVIMMDEYLPKDVTAKAKNIAAADSYNREDSVEPFEILSRRVPLSSSFPLSGKEDRLRAKGRLHLLYGWETIDLSGLEQLVDDSQTNALAIMLAYFKNHFLNDHSSLSEAVEQLYQHIENFGLDAVSPYTGHPGNLALPRKQEFYATLNRYRGLKIK